MKKAIAFTLSIICLLGLFSGCSANEASIQWTIGSIADGVYTNDSLALTFQIPEGWIDAAPEAAGENGAEQSVPESTDASSYSLRYDVDLRAPEDAGRMFVLHCDLYPSVGKKKLTSSDAVNGVETMLQEKYSADAVSSSKEGITLCGISYDALCVQTDDLAALFCVKLLSSREMVVIGIFGQSEDYVQYYTHFFTEDENTLPNPPVSNPVQGHGSFSRGRIYGGVYTSNYLKLRFTPPEKWIYAVDEELNALMGASFEIIGDDVYGDKTDFAKESAQQTVIYDMVCAAPNGSNVQIVFEDLQKIDGGTSLTAEDYAGIVCTQLQSITDYTYKLSEVRTEYLAETLYTVLDAEVENNMRQQFWLLRVDDYMLCITFTNMDGSPSDFVSCFSKIG